MTGIRDAVAGRSRMERLWIALPYVLLACCAVLAWVSGDLAGDVSGERAVLAGAAAVSLALWHGWWVVLHPRWPEARLAPMAVYFGGLVALAHYLTTLSVAFFPLYLVSYPMAFVALPGWWAYLGVGVAAAVTLLGVPPSPAPVQETAIGFGAAALVAVAGGSIRALESETLRRKAALADLQRTHAELQDALARNMDLQERLQAEARESGVAAERTRLAGEIHDTLAAGLGGIVSQLEALDAGLAAGHPLRRRVRSSLQLARETLQEARRSVRALRPRALANGTLSGAVSDAVARFERDHAVAVQWQVDGQETPLREPVAIALVRSADEALANVARHAAATSVHVTLSYLGDTVVLDVSDNGVGYPGPGGRPGTPSSNGPGTGHGLQIMRERAAALGGRMEVESTPGHGTTVTVLVPLEPGTVDGPR